MQPRIRPAEPGDLDALEALENAVFSADQLSRRSLRYYIGAPNAAFLVLEAEGTIAGDALLSFRRNSTLGRLYSIAVSPGQVGRGFGRLLLAAAEKAVRDRSGRALRLEVRSDNGPAIRLYRQAGYREFGQYPDYYEDGTAALRFEKDLRG